MPSSKPTIGILTGGGDCPGLNAVIRAAVKSALRLGYDCIGFLRGYEGLVDPVAYMPLDLQNTANILLQGGTILGSTNKGRFSALVGEGTRVRIDPGLLAAAQETVRQLGVTGLVCIGGDGSLAIAQQLHEHGIPVVGVPKTIDNDVLGTDLTFGFHTAVQIATDAIDRLHTTAESHDRVMVVEVMGRDTGWIAMYAGMAGGATVILVPEVPFDIAEISDVVSRRHNRGRYASIVVVAEGATPVPGTMDLPEYDVDQWGRPRYGGVSVAIAHEIEKRTGYEARVVQIGHVQRGGTPSAYDRILATRFGLGAVEAAHDGSFGTLIALKCSQVTRVPLSEVVGGTRHVDLDLFEQVRTAFFG